MPEHNLAIEFNDIFWHSEINGKNKDYHLNKTLNCNKKQITLVHIFENEWNNKQEIVKSKLCHLLKLNKQKYYSRKCTIKEINAKTEKRWFKQTHLQEYRPSTICYGLYTKDNELISAMSFTKSRYNKKYQWELLRFSSKLYTSVVGAAGKLFSYFIKQNDPDSIISYCDRRWSSGNMYKQIGFNFNNYSKPNYFYFKSFSAGFGSKYFG